MKIQALKCGTKRQKNCWLYKKNGKRLVLVRAKKTKKFGKNSEHTVMHSSLRKKNSLERTLVLLINIKKIWHLHYFPNYVYAENDVKHSILIYDFNNKQYVAEYFSLPD